MVTPEETATTLNEQAVALYHQGRYGEALPLCQRALAINEATLGPDHPDVAASLNNLAALYQAQGQYTEALPLLKRALAIWEKALGPDHPHVATNLNNLAELYRALGQYDRALSLYQRALAIDEKALGPDHPEVATNLNNLASLYKTQGQYGEALPLFKRALAIREKALGPDHPDVATNLNNLAGLYQALGQYGEALPLYQRALAIWEKTLGHDHPHVAQSLNNLADLYQEQRHYAFIEFRVTNFRSLRDEQVLSLVAAKEAALQETNTVASGLKAAPVLVRSAVIYGPNAAGKSNLIKALQYMRHVIRVSAQRDPHRPFAQPFRLDTATLSQPSEFEATFVLDGVRYQYGFALTEKRITSEYLLVYKTSRPQQWFRRTFEPTTNKDVYAFGAGLKGDKGAWERMTRTNALFLSVAVLLNSEQLRPVYDWFVDKLVFMNDLEDPGPLRSLTMLQHLSDKPSVLDFLTSSGISVADIEVISKKARSHSLELAAERDNLKREEKEVEQPKAMFHHHTDRGSAVFEADDESTGTQKMLLLAGHILTVLAKGLTLVADELNNSLHPLLVRRLVKMFHDPESNPRGAQLIFATHDTSLLSPSLFRRDQVWFIDTDDAQASTLYPLSDFIPRDGEALDRSYLIGRFGAVPFFD